MEAQRKLRQMLEQCVSQQREMNGGDDTDTRPTYGEQKGQRGSLTRGCFCAEMRRSWEHVCFVVNLTCDKHVSTCVVMVLQHLVTIDTNGRGQWCGRKPGPLLYIKLSFIVVVLATLFHVTS